MALWANLIAPRDLNSELMGDGFDLTSQPLTMLYITSLINTELKFIETRFLGPSYYEIILFYRFLVGKLLKDCTNEPCVYIIDTVLITHVFEKSI